MNSSFIIWNTLSQIPGLGLARLKKIAEKVKPIDRIFNYSLNDLFTIDGVSTKIATLIYESIKKIDLNNYASLVIPDGIKFTTISDENYPKLLFNIHDPPVILYYKGDLPKEDDICLAVVGTRTPTRYGLEVTEKIVKELVERGVTIISGLAYGIDKCAHETTLKYGGKTIAVLANGLSKIYPYSNTYLSEQILSSQGGLCSEYLCNENDFGKWDFARRNRIISGLSHGVIVIEGGEKSGALITARYALDQNREVFAVPGNIFSSKSIGPNNLIKSGAKLITCIEDIFEELPMSKDETSYSAKQFPFDNSFSDEENSILISLKDGPKTLDNIFEQTLIPFNRLSTLLVQMQMKGIIVEISRSIYERVV